MKKISFYYLISLIIYLPVARLFEAVLGKFLPTGAVFWITHWYEFALIAAILIGAISLIRSRSCPNFKVFNQPTLYFVVFSLISVVFFAGNLSRGLEGFRFTALAVAFFLYASVSNIDKKQTASLVKTYLVMASIVAAWALFERILPLNYWHALGLTDFGWGKYHLAGSIYQSATFMNGPNQVASYLLPAFFIVLNQLFEKKHYPNQKLVLVVLFFGIVFTFSRSAAIALVIVSSLSIALAPIKAMSKFWIAGVSVAALILLFLSLGPASTNVQALLYHGPSQADHEKSLQVSLNAIQSRTFDKLMIGAGIGSAGPAALKYGDGIVSESWYLQLILELGVIGLALWIWLATDLLLKLYRMRSELSYGLAAVSIMAIFLHTWADNPAVTISLLILIGLLPTKTNNETIV